MPTSDLRTEFFRNRQLLMEALLPVLKEQLASSKVRAGNVTGSSYSKSPSSAGGSSLPFMSEVVSFSAKFTSVHGQSHDVRLEFSVSGDGWPRVSLSADKYGPGMDYTVDGDISGAIRHLGSSIVGLFETLCGSSGKPVS